MDYRRFEKLLPITISLSRRLLPLLLEELSLIFRLSVRSGSVKITRVFSGVYFTRIRPNSYGKTYVISCRQRRRRPVFGMHPPPTYPPEQQRICTIGRHVARRTGFPEQKGTSNARNAVDDGLQSPSHVFTHNNR